MRSRRAGTRRESVQLLEFSTNSVFGFESWGPHIIWSAAVVQQVGEQNDGDTMKYCTDRIFPRQIEDEWANSQTECPRWDWAEKKR